MAKPRGFYSTEHERITAQLNSFGCALQYLHAPEGRYYHHRGLFADVAFCLQFAGMA